MVGEIEKVMVTNNDDLLVFDRHNKSILLFGSTGIFKNRIGIFGHAKNEYIEPLDMVYDEHCDNVIVYDNAKKALMYYDMNGEFLKSILLNEYIESFEVLDGSHLVLYCGYKGLGSNDINYNYKILDTKGNVVKKYAPFDKTMEKIVMPPYPFQKHNGKLYCHIEGTPVLNEITLKEMKPTYLINFGKNQLPNYYYIDGYKTYNEKVISLEPSKAITGKVFQTDRYILMTFTCSGSSSDMYEKIMITPKSHLSQPKYYFTMINDLYGKQSSLNLSLVANDKVYFVYSSTTFNSLAELKSDTDVSTVVAKMYRNVAKRLTGVRKTINSNIVEVLERPTTSIIVTNKEKKMMDSLFKSNNPIIQICTLKK